MTLQAAFASMLLVVDQPDDPHPLLSHQTSRVIILINAILAGIVAQVKRQSLPPLKRK
jgi:hypothetical protein